MAKRVSIKDIAHRAGVSTASVSYVLNGLEKQKRISPKVVTRIREAAKELNYIPNQIAKSLRRGTTNTIGLIVADIANPFFSQLARIIEDEAIDHSHMVIFGSSDEDCAKSESLIETFLNRQVDGLIIVPSEGCGKQIIGLVKKEIPLVLIDRYMPNIETNYVVLDNYEAVYKATVHLVIKGYKRIGMIAYKNSLIHMTERTRGYEQAMKDCHLSNEVRVKKIPFHTLQHETEKMIKDAILEWKPEAMIFATNALSLSGLYSIQDIGIKVPEELAIVGFDGNEAFDFFYSPLTYVKQPVLEMGKEAVRVLIDQIEGSKKISQISLSAQLVLRNSC